MKFRKKSSIKAVLLSAAAVTTSLLMSMAAACSTTTAPDDEDENTSTKQDVQVIKNGNFEFYDDNDGLYPISEPENWTSGSTGTSSSAMGGVINTSQKGWNYITDKALPDTLEANDDLESDDENKKDYNGALRDDMLYKNTHAATEDDAPEEDMAYIDNPFTHKYSYDDEGNVLDAQGEKITTYEKDGKVYLDEECTEELETSVLMLHNYRPSYFKGTETYYSSSTTVTLEARTAAKFSVWVKTSELYFGGTKNERTKVENEHGAYIKLETQVGGNSLDNFFIRNINTEVLNPDGDNNGWVEYTVFIQASSFAETTVQVTLGLGQDEIYTVEGYAFFDDAKIETFDDEAAMIENAEEELGSGNFENTVNSDRGNIANLLDPDGKSEFRADKVSIKTNDPSSGGLVDKTYEYNSADRHFYIDLTSSESTDSAITLDSASVKAGFTVEKTANGKFVSSKGTSTTLKEVGNLNNESGAGSAYLPSGFKGVDTDNDLLATFNITADSWTFNANNADYIYNDVLTEALKSGASLPGVQSGSTSAFVIMSAHGASYEAQITSDSFTVAPRSYLLVSFWLKTSDMKGNVAATITVEESGTKQDKNSSSFSLDTTTLDGITINDKEDVYDGWAECFIRVENSSEEDDKSFTLKLNFGTTTISGTNINNYNAGWLAIANVSAVEMGEEVYDYTSSLSNCASLSLTDEETEATDVFDSEKGDKNEIKSDLAIPANYNGANGGSAEISKSASANTDYDATNRNDYAGLLNKENLDNYKSHEWFTKLNITGADNDEIWNKLAGKYSVQPLLIVNAKRDFADMGQQIYNYGYIGSNLTLSADGYQAVSVRVKVSEGAVANIYLVDTDLAGRKGLSFSIPEYTFWYDDDGNILKGEPKEKASLAELKENIAYTLRSDGLYENGDGKLYANFYNLKKDFLDLDFEHNADNYYDESGKAYKYDGLTDGVIYYADAAKTTYAPHYLVADGNKVYKYVSGIDDQATYYYMVNGKPDTSKIIYGVDTAKAALRYDNTSGEKNYAYQFTIDATTAEGKEKYAGKWVTVTFFLHAGSEAKSYKLELWSGYRDQQTTENVTENSYVLFDYSSKTLDESTFASLKDYYTQAIIAEYKKNITEEQDKLIDNIAEYEKKLTAEQVENIRKAAFNYVAEYYTYTLYDSDLYVPFNADTAKDGETGYAYNYSDYDEQLAYLRIEEKIAGGEEFIMSAFADYSLFDKDISIGTSTTVEPDDDTDSSTGSSDSTNFWLLFSSIVLLAAILVALLVILGKDLFKKLWHGKSAGKNTYNFTKNKRYVRKYVKANGEVGESDEPADTAESGADANLVTAPEETDGADGEEKAEEKAEETAETPDGEKTEEAPAEEKPEEAPTEAPEEEKTETPAEDTPSDGEDKKE